MGDGGAEAAEATEAAMGAVETGEADVMIAVKAAGEAIAKKAVEAKWLDICHVLETTPS